VLIFQKSFTHIHIFLKSRFKKHNDISLCPAWLGIFFTGCNEHGNYESVKCSDVFLIKGCIRNLNVVLSQRRNKRTPWTESASELYRPGDRRLSGKLVQTFTARGVSRSRREKCRTAAISISRPETLVWC
jgi:hypothetical protein